MALFGKRASSQPQSPPGPAPIDRLIRALGGNQKILDSVRSDAANDPQGLLRVAGAVLFDNVYQLTKDNRGARIEDILAILASVGGHACIVGALDMHFKNGGKTSQSELTMLMGKDGIGYYFGDLPNRALLESPESLLSMALGAAQTRGGNVSLEKVHDVMRHVASTIGKPEFGVPRIVGDHRPGDLPVNYIKSFSPMLFKALRAYEVPLNKCASAFGFAVYKAIAMVDKSLDPTIAADIVTECAVPAAKIDPARFRHFGEIMTP
jgi:hypothetical protein